jgi:hypothetical protein
MPSAKARRGIAARSTPATKRPRRRSPSNSPARPERREPRRAARGQAERVQEVTALSAALSPSGEAKTLRTVGAQPISAPGSSPNSQLRIRVGTSSEVEDRDEERDERDEREETRYAIAGASSARGRPATGGDRALTPGAT